MWSWWRAEKLLSFVGLQAWGSEFESAGVTISQEREGTRGERERERWDVAAASTISLQVRDCWSCGAWLPTLAGNHPWRSNTQDELWSLVVMGVRKSGNPSCMTQSRALGRVSRGLDYLVDSLSKDVLQASVGEIEVSDGGMFKCSGDHSESWEEHSEWQSRGTSRGAMRHNEYGPAWKLHNIGK